ncbi:glycosyltransferase family 25 protein [Chitinimonas sp. BJYL2]|uniref:glycosyltransferase family 25 protein n=1 Tax=Chitinimonas sp. BJYL2 TaxID=2976696 RepID=UPI0022B2E18B|nr:glycosyltransferase family 25 protein [Chitinimonas sp. BJYL2]
MTADALPRIHILSLADCTERRVHMAEQFAHHAPGIAYEFFDAQRISRREDYPADYDVRARQRLFGDDLRPGEVGCFMSHRALWQACAASPDAAWCILEDDIVLTPDFVPALRALMAHRQDWDIVRLMTLLPRRGGWCQQALDASYALHAHDRPPSGLQGYLIQPHSAAALAKLAASIVWPIDETVDLYWQHKQRLYTLMPAAIDLAPAFNSTIGQRSSSRRPRWRKWQRELINGWQGLSRKLFNLRHYGRC